MRRTSLFQVRRIAAVLGMSCALAMAAQASPITYTMRGVATGSLGARNFSDAAFAVAVVTDTDTVYAHGPGIPCNLPKAATVSITGVGSASVDTPIFVTAPIFVNGSAAWQMLALGRGNCPGSADIWTYGYNPNAVSYGLDTSMPPAALAMPTAPPGITVETSSGVLAFDRVSALTFEAAMTNAMTPIPTLSGGGLGLVTLMLAGIGAAAARTRRAASA
jgi:hypothetical protein